MTVMTGMMMMMMISGGGSSSSSSLRILRKIKMRLLLLENERNCHADVSDDRE
jgi:hypothetical protein